MEMDQNIVLSTNMQQKMILTPALLQSLKVLQLSKYELIDYINDELSENPYLEEEGTEKPGTIDENRLMDIDETMHKLEYLDESSAT